LGDQLLIHKTKEIMSNDLVLYKPHDEPETVFMEYQMYPDNSKWLLPVGVDSAPIKVNSVIKNQIIGKVVKTKRTF